MTPEQADAALIILADIRDAQVRNARWAWVGPVSIGTIAGLAVLGAVGGTLKRLAADTPKMWRWRPAR